MPLNIRVENPAAYSGAVLGGEPSPGTAPVITQQPSISPASPVAGQTVKINWGAATGTPAPTQDRVFLMDGSDASSQLTGNTFVAQEGQYMIDGEWSNGVGAPVPVVPVSFVLDAAPVPEIDYDTMAIAYWNGDTPITGTDSDVLTMMARGTGAVVYAKTGTGTISRAAGVDGGFGFTDGAYFQSQNLTGQPTTDGMFAVASLTLTTYGSNTGIILDGAGGHIKLRNNSGTVQFLAQDDTAQTMVLGAMIYNTRVTIAGEVDDVTDIMRAFNMAGSLAVNPTAHAGMTDPALSRLVHGRYINGTIHEFAIVGKPEGGDWPVTMEAVFADFTRGA